MGNSVVDLGAAGSLNYLDMGDMSLNDALGLTRDNPAYVQDSGFSGPSYAEDQTRPADLTGPFLEEYAPVDGAYQRLDYYDMYQDFPEGRSGSDFGPSAPEIAMQDGGIVGGLENLGRMSTAMIESLDRAVYGGGSGGRGRPAAPVQQVGFLGSGTGSDNLRFAFPVPQNALGGGLLPPPIQPGDMQDQNIHADLSAQYGPLPPGRYASNIQKEMSPDSPYFNVPDRSQMQPLVGFNENNPYQMQPLGSSNANNQNLMLSQGTNMRSIFGFEDGGEVPVEEAGIGSFMYDVVTGKVPSDQYNAMRTSGRMDDPMAQAIYGQDPTFMEQLVKDYDYPANIPMEDAQGYAIMDPETGGQKMMMATDFNLPEYMRTGRPRQDMPTYGELEDARAHALASALMAKDYGPETAKTAGGIKEFSEMLPGFGSSKYKDTKMDLRNNALGVKLLKEAGVNATPAQLARTVDREVFKQIDRILDRPEDRQNTPAKDQPFADHYFKSPEGGLDVYFPRDKDGYFDTSYIYD